MVSKAQPFPCTILTNRQYKCGCIAPKLSNISFHRCKSWGSRRSCQPKQLFSYLDVDCGVVCGWDVGSDKIPHQPEDSYIQRGTYQGELSEEDYFFHRVPTQLNEPISARRTRKRQAIAGCEGATNSSRDRKVVTYGDGEAGTWSGEKDASLGLVPDVVVDKLKPNEHLVLNPKFVGCFSRKKK
jgi:hypothetical protein